jgi:hypothetical protein
MTFLTGCSRISFRPRPCLQKRNIGPSTEINDYSFWTLRGQSSWRMILPVLAWLAEERGSFVGTNEGRLDFKRDCILFIYYTCRVSFSAVLAVYDRC